MKECKIVEDLMPLYAEELVSRETGDFIREHLRGCENCRRRMARFSVPLDCSEKHVDYKKNLRKDIRKIAGKVLLAVMLVAVVIFYGLWETGILDREVYESPDGRLRFTVIDADAGFFEGGAYIATPEEENRNLYRDDTYRDFHVWFSPDSEKYFVWIEFDDHDETYLVWEGYAGNGFENAFYPSHEIEQRNFFGVLQESEMGQYLFGGENVTITFDRWSQHSKNIYLNFETEDGAWGEFAYDTENLRFLNSSKNLPTEQD